MRLLAWIGGYVLEKWRDACYLTAVLIAVIWEGARPRSWPRTVRRSFGRQLHSLGVESVLLTGVVAILLGLVVVALSRRWGGGVLRPELLNPLLVLVVARELGPLFTVLIVMTRNGSAITAELGILKASGGVSLLEAQGIDPFLYLIMPRALAAALAVLCLTVIFIAISFAASFSFGTIVNYIQVSPEQFLDTLLELMSPGVIIVILAKSILPALLFGIICSTQGLAVKNISEVPWAVRRAMVRSIIFLFIVSAVLPFVVYV
jgi:phospholipid/cholesterol/gamma-HCH transport system permease protein